MMNDEQAVFRSSFIISYSSHTFILHPFTFGRPEEFCGRGRPICDIFRPCFLTDLLFDLPNLSRKGDINES
jgi:hypothetical protein